jgi:deoxyguanosine kinase
MYHRVHEALAEKIPPPDLVVYLRADTEMLMQRIALRDRSYERYMERSYIDQLNRAYEAYFGGANLGSQPGAAPVLAIDTNHLDFVHRPDDLKLVEHRIRQALHLEPYQAELPLDFDRSV